MSRSFFFNLQQHCQTAHECFLVGFVSGRIASPSRFLELVSLLYLLVVVATSSLVEAGETYRTTMAALWEVTGGADKGGILAGSLPVVAEGEWTSQLLKEMDLLLERRMHSYFG